MLSIQRRSQMHALRICLTAFILFTITNGFSQEKINGIVKSEGQTVVGAYVYWKNQTNFSTTTDTMGKFTLDRHSIQDTLVVGMVGFENLEVFVPKHQEFIEITLKPSTVLKGVQIGESKLPKTLDMRNVRQVTRFSEQEFTKAACCNLSESFENISSVDVTTSDAVTGIKQIQMMGFSGIYIQTQIDNMPFSSGLIAASGLTYIPGVWVKGMQLSKGVGSVTNGYEGMTGSLNIELRKPLHKERLILNGYFNPSNMRSEGNIIFTHQLSNTWATTLMMHGSAVSANSDINQDGIQDFPLQNNLQVSNQWMFVKNKWEGNIGFKYFNYQQELGTINTAKTGGENWQSAHNDERFELNAMAGYIFSKEPVKSMGFRVNAVNDKLQNRFGNTNYLGIENSVRVNWVVNTLFKNTLHKITAGLSFYGNQTDEKFVNQDYNLDMKRREYVPGVFAEWTESSIKKLLLVGGIRADYHNFFGLIITPRLHGNLTLNKNTQLRFGGGRGQRTANPFADYQGLFSSNRRVQLPSQINNGFYGLQQEVSWNTGASLSKTFKMLHRPATLVVDYYYTWFDEQLQVDRDSKADELQFYNLSAFGLKSYSHSTSVELDFSPARRSEVRMAYRFIDSRSGFMDGITRFNPLISPHRAFVNGSYETRSGWSFDLTINWQSSKRLPQGNFGSVELLEATPTQSPSYTSVMAQVMKKFSKKFEVYAGGENLLNIMQQDLIRLSTDPSSPYFDPTLIWGPSLGAMFYVGFRYYVY